MKLQKMISVLFVLSMASCGAAGVNATVDDEIVGGGCEFAEYTGTAVITAIEAVGEDEASCTDAVRIEFDFSADQSGDDITCATTGRTYEVGEGLNPNRDWATSKGFEVGANFDVVLMQETSGTCSPCIFDFVTVDDSDYGDSCF